MKVLYVGQYSEGTTSKMRGEVIKKILTPKSFEVIDTHIPFHQTSRFLRSFGFRYKKGPLIGRINKNILDSIKEDYYDLVWVDKAVFINFKTTKLLKEKTAKLVHFTPDPAFTFHQSKLFFNSIPLYDYAITTKSYELEAYRATCEHTRVLYATQGFDKELHKPSQLPFSRKEGIVFIGHYEKERASIIELLLANSILVTLAGVQWENFAKKHQNNNYLNYLGKGVYAQDYVKTLQGAKIAWGAISKWVPELHTTRTFEIPACGTALLTEKNVETASFFQDDEVLFYENEDDLISQVLKYIDNDEVLQPLTEKGTKRVLEDGFDYTSILQKLLNTVMS